MIPNTSPHRIFSDTDPAVEQLLIDLMRKKTATEKLEMVGQLNASLRVLTLSGVRERYPEALEVEIKYKLAEVLFGSELAQKIVCHKSELFCK